jgi:signal peptidase II
MLAGYTWLLALVSAVAAVVILLALLRDSFPHLLGQLALALILGGAVGNLIDRVRFGFVVDMFSLQFMNFAIFNVADIGVSIGGVLLCIYVLFYWNKGKEAKA